jgi:hypothetical protein
MELAETVVFLFSLMGGSLTYFFEMRPLNKKGVLFKDFKPNSGANLVPRLEMGLETKKGLKKGFL